MPKYMVGPWCASAPELGRHAGYFDLGKAETVEAPTPELAAALYPHELGQRFRVLVELHQVDKARGGVQLIWSNIYHVTRKAAEAAHCSWCSGSGFQGRERCTECGSVGREPL